jgi:hypothetical protein
MSNTEHPNGALGTTHVLLASSSIFAGVAAELTAIVGEHPIEVEQDGEKEAGRTRELVWLLDLPG